MHLYLEMIALDAMGDDEIACLSSCPKLRDFTWSSYGGSYDITVEGAQRWKKACPDLEYVGAYRMQAETKLALRSMGVGTR